MHVYIFYCSNISNGVVGFDCEWIEERSVSLLQLATSTGVCALFRLEKIGYIPPKLKVGVYVYVLQQ